MAVPEHANLSDIKERLPEGEKTERFLIRENGDVETLLPGEDLIIKANNKPALIVFPKDFSCRCVAGTGISQNDSSIIPGGWAEFDCRLISARRFVLKKKVEILEDKKAEQILGLMARDALKKGFLATYQVQPGTRADTVPVMEIWKNCRREVKRTLLDAGWFVNSFSLAIHRVTRCTKE